MPSPRDPQQEDQRFDVAILREQVGLLADLLEADAGSLTEGELADGVLALAKLSGQVDAAFTEVVGAFDAHQVHVADGARTAQQWIAARSEIPTGQVNAVRKRARCLRSCPASSKAYRQGALGTAKVRLLLAAREDVEAQFLVDEEWLVRQIERLTVPRARLFLERWRATALASAGLDDDKPPTDPGDNSLHVSTTFGGRRAISGDLDSINGATLQNLIAAEVDRLFNTGEFRPDDGLKPSQRASRALLNLVERGAKSSSLHGEVRPSVTLLIDLRTLLGIPVVDATDLLLRRSNLVDGTPVDRQTAIELLTRAHLTAVLGSFATDGRFHPTAEIRETRAPNGRQRRALDLRDEGCVFPGCTSPPAHTHAHHVDTWQATHQTTVPRLVLLCSFHHHAIHDRGFGLSLDGSKVTVTRPDGTELPHTPHGQRIPTHTEGSDRGPAPPTRYRPTRFRPLSDTRSAARRKTAWKVEQLIARLADPNAP